MNRMFYAKVSAAAVLALGSTGCPSIGTVQKADTLGQGNWEVSIEPGAYGVKVEKVNATLPVFNVAFRYGVTERVDIGVRAGTTLAELQTKFLLTEPTSDTIAVSLAPALGGAYYAAGDAGGGYLNLPIPVLVGLKLGKHELTFSGRAQNILVFAGTGSSSTTGYALALGGSLGFAAQITDGFRLMPEFAMISPVFGAASATAGGSSASGSGFAQTGAIVYNFNLGIQFGKMKKKKPGEKPNEGVELTAQ